MADQDTPKPIAEISHEPSKFDQFLEQNQKKIVIIVALTVLALLAFVTKSGLEKISKQDAGSALFKAKTAEDLQQVINQQNSAETKATATLLLAKAQAKTDLKAAIATLQKHIDNYPTSAIAYSAKLNLALYQLKDKQIKEGTQGLELLASDSNAASVQVFALYTLADIALEKKDKANAQKYFKKAAQASKNFKLNQLMTTYSEYAGYTAPKRISPRPVESKVESSPEAEVKLLETKENI